MSKEALQIVAQNAPYIAGVASAAVGVVVDRVAFRSSADKRQGVLHTQGISEQEFQNRRRRGVANLSDDNQAPISETAYGSFGERAFIPGAMGLAGMLLVAAWAGTPAPKSETSTLELIGDRNVVTLQDNADKKVEGIFKQFEKTGSLKVKATLAHNSGVSTIKVDQIKDADPFGGPSVNVAATQVLSTLREESSEQSPRAKDEKPNKAILVATANNGLGEVSSVVRRAKDAGNVPINIVNVAPADGQVTRNLKTIARKTGGKYYSEKADPQRVAREVEAQIKPKETAEPAKTGNNAPLKIASIMTTLLAAGLVKRRADAQFRGKRRKNQ
jgi:hypothetical protein